MFANVHPPRSTDDVISVKASLTIFVFIFPLFFNDKTCRLRFYIKFCYFALLFNFYLLLFYLLLLFALPDSVP